jgi:hypothetical protein
LPDPWVAAADLPDERAGPVDKLAVVRPVHQRARQAATALACVAGPAHDRLRDNLLKVDPRQQNVGRLAAQLKDEALERGRGELSDLPADGGGPGEGYEVDAVVLAQCLGDIGCPKDEVDRAGREACFVDQPEQRGGREYRFGRRHQDNAAPGRERWPHLERGQAEQVVIGGHAEHHADRCEF